MQHFIYIEMNFETYFLTLYPLMLTNFVCTVYFKVRIKLIRFYLLLSRDSDLDIWRPWVRFCRLFYFFDLYAINIQFLPFHSGMFKPSTRQSLGQNLRVFDFSIWVKLQVLTLSHMQTTHFVITPWVCEWNTLKRDKNKYIFIHHAFRMSTFTTIQELSLLGSICFLSFPNLIYEFALKSQD